MIPDPNIFDDNAHSYGCECGRDDCAEASLLTNQEWEEVRKRVGPPDYFEENRVNIVNPGHIESGQTLVEKHERYWLTR